MSALRRVLLCSWRGHVPPDAVQSFSWVQRTMAAEGNYHIEPAGGQLWVDTPETRMRVYWRCQRCASMVEV